MSQRDSGYTRLELDQYETPEWVTEAVIPYIPFAQYGTGTVSRIWEPEVWEPACGSGKMVRVLEKYAYMVHATDIKDGIDFLKEKNENNLHRLIITNPPYVEAQKFIEHALHLTCPIGMVVMLLRADFDHAKTRQHLFGKCPQFSKKVALTKRIVWFEDKDKKKNNPSYNHAWYIWDWQHEGPATLSYAP
jgi:methylase of polypeptide subunit release factors